MTFISRAQYSGAHLRAPCAYSVLMGSPAPSVCLCGSCARTWRSSHRRWLPIRRASPWAGGQIVNRARQGLPVSKACSPRRSDPTACMACLAPRSYGVATRPGLAEEEVAGAKSETLPRRLWPSISPSFQNYFHSVSFHQHAPTPPKSCPASWLATIETSGNQPMRQSTPPKSATRTGPGRQDVPPRACAGARSCVGKPTGHRQALHEEHCCA